MRSEDRGRVENVHDRHAGISWVIAAVFLQMLPATLVAPAIRPLFASLHGGAEGPMHAFMSLNMLGGILTTPFIARLVSSGRASASWLRGLALLDMALLLAVAMPIATPLVLVLRTIEGAAHLGASTLLLARAASFKPVLGAGRAMGLAGGAVMMAIALGSGLGGLLVAFSPQLPFVVGAALALLAGSVAPLVYATRLEETAIKTSTETRPSLRSADVWGPLTAVFVERCTVGMIIVTFALFATRVHGFSDRAVGLHYSLLTLPFALLMYPASRLGDFWPRGLLMGAGAIAYGGAIASLALVSGGSLGVSMLMAGVASSLLYGSVLCYAATLVSAAARPRMMAWVNTAGALGMLVGPALGGIIATVAKSEADPAHAYRFVFLAAGSLAGFWFLLMAPWLFQRIRSEMVLDRHALSTTE